MDNPVNFSNEVIRKNDKRRAIAIIELAYAIGAFDKKKAVRAGETLMQVLSDYENEIVRLENELKKASE